MSSLSQGVKAGGIRESEFESLGIRKFDLESERVRKAGGNRKLGIAQFVEGRGGVYQKDKRLVLVKLCGIDADIRSNLTGNRLVLEVLKILRE